MRCLVARVQVVLLTLFFCPLAYGMEVAIDVDLKEYFTVKTYFEPTENFEVSSFAAHGSTMFVGVSAGGACNADGAFVGRITDGKLRHAFSPNEQGMRDMLVHDGRLYVLGVDPVFPPYNWNWGNFYVYDGSSSGAFQMYRNMPRVIHGWSLTKDPVSGDFYAAVSSIVSRDQRRSVGEILVSRDRGSSWQVFADADDGMGTFRNYHVLIHDDTVITVIKNRSETRCRLASKALSGTSEWRYEEHEVECSPRPVVFQNQVYFFQGQTLFSLATGTYKDLPFMPKLTFQNTTQSANQLFVISADDQIWATGDLESWSPVVSTDLAVSAIGYLQDLDCLYIGTKGLDATIYRECMIPPN